MKRLALARKRSEGGSDSSALSSQLEDSLNNSNNNESDEVPKKRTRRSRNSIGANSTATSPEKRISLSNRLSTNGYDNNLAMRCGKVLSIRLKNFMCHDNLVIDFHNRINFLVGSNGSGKSAIMAALVLGLGAKAKDTNRSACMKKFIKTGETSAKIEVSILNSGIEAFEHDVYGNKITICRTISQSTSTFTIKSENGQVISKKVDDLNRILMYHSIQVNNPIFVLNQDASREFLKELEPKKNFKLFQKATLIETVMDKLQECVLSHNEHVHRLKCMQSKIEKDIQHNCELKRKLEARLSLNKLKEKLNEYQTQLHWLAVKEQELKIEEIMTDQEKLEQKRQKFQDLVKNNDTQEAKIKEELKKVAEDIQDQNSKYATENNNFQEIRRSVLRAEQKYNEMQIQMSSYEKRKQYIENIIKDIKETIEEHIRNKRGDVTEIRQQNEAKLKKLREEHEESKALMDSATRDMKIFADNRSQTAEETQTLFQKRQGLTREIAQLSNRINDIQASSKDKLSIFGEHVVRFVSELEKLHKLNQLTEMPRGPIGSFVEVPNSKYRDVVEQVIQSLLHGYIVNCKADCDVVHKLLETKFPSYKPSVITTKFTKEVYDVSSGSVTPVRGTRRVMDEIKCDDPVVMNCLIDNFQVETILLTESRSIAEQITSNIENVPQRLNRVILTTFSLEYYPDPHYRMYSLKIRPARYVQVNVEDRIKQLQIDKSELEARLQSLVSKEKECKERSDTNESHLSKTRILIAKHEQKKTEIQEKIYELENFEYPDRNEMDVLKRELSVNEDKLNEANNKFNSKAVEAEQCKEAKESLEAKLVEKKEFIKNMQTSLEDLHRTAGNLQKDLQTVQNGFRDQNRKFKEIEDGLKVFENKKSEALSVLQTVTNKAKKVGDRIDSHLSEDQIKESICKIQEQIKKSSNIQEDPEDLRNQISENDHQIERDQNFYSAAMGSVSMLKRSLQQRYDFICTLRKQMFILLQFNFSNILALRNYSGKVELDIEKETLNISVIPRDKNVEKAVSSTRALSGGERSYTTVAFLIALWSCVDHPFYFLDEYDVFTDEVNRSYMTSLLMAEGEKCPNRQYVFLTPQDTALKSSDLVKIHRLAKPIRQ